MASLSSGSTSDLPKPETDLAEWTNKIKALQKQVDADEEAQQKSLEDEIVSARRARLRRRSGIDAESHVNSLDICMSTGLHTYEVDTRNLANHNEDLSLHISDNDRDNVPDYSDRLGVEQKIDRDTALRKLMGTNNVYNPDKISTSVRATEPTSLATFIGGRASGPRLNRHAPQQDAHDPTQFVQPDTSRPHPIFGRGGIAMPGMANIKGSNTYGSIAGSESSERYRPSSLTAKPKSPSPPIVNASSRMEMNNRSSVDISRLSLTGPSKVAERYLAKIEDSPVHLGGEIPQSNLPSFRTGSSKVVERHAAKVEDSPVHLGTDIPQSNLPSFRTTKSTFSAPSSPFTKKDTGQEQDSYLRNSDSSNKLANRSLSNIPNSLPQVSVSSSAGSLKFGSSYKSDTSTSSITPNPKSTSSLVGAQSSVKPLTTRTKSAERARDTPLRKLMEINNIHNPDTAAPQAPQKSETSSLASFIGGRATGPRLNRHAPQQDVHDPTQFVQPELSAPHPVFGKGGIAMPGMMTKPLESSFSTPPKSMTPSANSRGENAGSRITSGSSSESFASVDHRLSKGFSAATRDRTISTPSYSRNIGTSHELSRSSVSPTPRLSNSILGLAQPIRPDIKVSSVVPQIPSAYMPSPAFQKPLSQKDPTPSISRLQGRGFVQSMVKVSAEISSPTTPSPSKSRPASGRKNTVLDRWQPNMQADTSPTRPTSSHPDVMRRSTTFNTMNTISDNLNNVSTHATGSSRTLKSMASLPSLINAATPKEIDPPVDESLVPDKPSGLGSASTMVVLKPSKSSGDLGQVPWHEELGMKHNPTNISRQGSPFSPLSEKATSSRKSLIHVR